MLAALCRAIVKTFFRQVVIEGRENLQAARPAIFTPNHPNALLDPMLLFFLPSPSRLRFVAKAPLFKFPVLGWMLRELRAIPVVRHLDTQGEIDYTTFFAACVDSLAMGDSIVIFPEGRSLPQPSMAPLRTGAARLYFLAREKGIDATIIPVGLNYERGAIFRSSVLVAIAPPLDTNPFAAPHATDPARAVRGLTAEINRSLAEHVFQAETYRDRELMLLLERLYAEDEPDDSWPQRWARLKEFEAGLQQLRGMCANEINRLRQLLSRYERLSVLVGVNPRQDPKDRPGWTWLFEAVGWIIASVGLLLNWLPYRLCAVLVRLARGDESMAATYKILFSLILFPLTYVVEGILIARWFGPGAAAAFALLIVPLSYFTLLFFEWRQELGARPPTPLPWLSRTRSHRVAEQLARLRQQIVAEVEALAARPELK
jgi:1-acyl-sn-glycerol-3-phosphate acyltransferase